MNYSIKEIQTKLKRSKATIYAKMKELDFYNNSDLLIHENTRTFITESGLQLLKKSLNISEVVYNDVTEPPGNTNEQFIEKILLNYEQQIEELKKDKMELMEQVKNLTQILAVKEHTELTRKQLLLEDTKHKKISFFSLLFKKKISDVEID